MSLNQLKINPKVIYRPPVVSAEVSANRLERSVESASDSRRCRIAHVRMEADFHIWTNRLSLLPPKDNDRQYSLTVIRGGTDIVTLVLIDVDSKVLIDAYWKLTHHHSRSPLAWADTCVSIRRG